MLRTLSTRGVMYFKSDYAMWDDADHDKRKGAKNIGYVADKLRAVSIVSTFNEEVLLMWRGHINLKYIFVVNDGGETVEPYQDFVDRVTALRERDPTLVERCLQQVRKGSDFALLVDQLRKMIKDGRERGNGLMVDDSQEVSACA